MSDMDKKMILFSDPGDEQEGAMDVTALRAQVYELTRLLGEAEERATILAQTILALMQKHSVYPKGKAVGMSDGEAFARAVSDAVQRAIQGAPR